MLNILDLKTGRVYVPVFKFVTLGLFSSTIAHSSCSIHLRRIEGEDVPSWSDVRILQYNLIRVRYPLNGSPPREASVSGSPLCNFFSSVKLRRSYHRVVAKGRVSGSVSWNVNQFSPPSCLSSLSPCV